jgi:hypothetical protein
MNRTTTVFGLMAHLNSLLLTFVDFIVGKRGNPLSCSEGNGSIGLDSDGGEIALGGIRMGSSCVVSWECGSSVPPRRIGSSCAMVYPLLSSHLKSILNKISWAANPLKPLKFE